MDRRFIALLPQADGRGALVTSRDGHAWERYSIAEDLRADTALARGPDDALGVAYRDDEGQVWVAVVGDDGRVDPHRIRGARTPYRPAITWWHDTWVVACTAEDGALFVARADAPAALRFRRAHRFAASSQGPALAATPARVFMAFTGTDGRVYLGSSDDGATFELIEVEHREGDRIDAAPSLCAWGPDLAVAVVDARERLLVASSRGASSLAFAHVGDSARSRFAPSMALTDEGYTLLIAGTDGALWTAAGALDALAASPVDSLATVSGASLAASRAGEPSQPSRTTVAPVLFYPADVAVDAASVEAMRAVIAEHLALAQQRYQRWLGTDTFPFVDTRIVRGARAHRDYRRGDAWSDLFAEILADARDCNATCTTLYVTLFVRPAGFESELWLGSGGPGCSEGSGMVLLDARCVLEDEPYCFQSTLVHELGHAFGLPHVEAWGEDMDQCESIMSYNPRHCVRGPNAPEPEATFLPEEYAALGANEVAFPRFAFDPAAHNPSGAPLRRSREG